MNTAYKELLDKYAETKLLGTISGVLYWDMNTYMPSNQKAIEYRAKQFQYISQKTHKLSTDPKILELIKECEKDNSLDSVQQRNIELIKRAYENRTALSTELVGKLAAQSNKTLEIWKKAKAKEDFKMVLPELEKLFGLNVEAAELYAKSKGMNDPFDALIDTREKGFSVKLLSNLFDEVKKFLIPFIKRIQKAEIQPERDFLFRSVPQAIQVKMVEELAKFLEYDFYSPESVGNLSEVEHPLTIGCGLNDVRVTVKYHENNVLAAFFAGAHECGHALHSLQGRLEWYNQPIHHISSPSFGESQSRFLENVVAGSKEFWTYYYPKFQKDTQGRFDDINLETFYLAFNAVNPGFIRIQADELTYILHIIIRFEIERDWFAGKIETKELPEVWNAKYFDYLGVKVPNDSLGVMQDLHWYSQYYGYFFGYGIGDLISSQIAAKLTQDKPEWRDLLQEGNYSPIRQWLAENIHELGGLYDCLDLVEHITDSKLSASHHKEYLEKKFSSLYSL
ncbi:MAG: carboxypeptidase M32 [Candidatus Heimdallarchaeaceae archaeon]